MTFETGIEWINQALDRALVSGRASAKPTPVATDQVPPLDILVPVFGAFEDLRRCVDALRLCTGPQHRIWLLDDASEDARIGDLARLLVEQDARFQYRRRMRTLGFVVNVNLALEETDRDLVILNSDAIVTPEWLERLCRSTSTGERVGVVSPLSNNATLLSITRDSRPVEDLDELATAVALTATAGPVAIPTAVGFCMLIKRELVEEIGLFDVAFSPGYGEEVDFCLRAWQAGWRVVACSDAYVHHRGQASFGDTSDRAWRRNHERLLASRWPAYETVVRGWWRNNPLRVQIERLAARDRQKPLVVHLLHRWSTLGGTEILTRRLIAELADEFDHLVILPGTGHGQWADAVAKRLAPGIELMYWNSDYRDQDWHVQGEAAGLQHPWLDQWLARILSASGARILHIHHLLGWGTLLPALIGRAVGLKVVLSLHCFHYLCPDYNQIGPNGLPCGKRIVDTGQDCLQCLAARTRTAAGNVDESLPEYLGRRRSLVRQVIAVADRLTAPSHFLHQRMVAAFGPGVCDRFNLIPHDGPVVHDAQPVPAGSTLVAVYMGGLKRLKGSDVLLRAAEMLKPDVGLEIRLYGPDGQSVAGRQDWPPNCQWLGAFLPEHGSRIFQAADVLIVPSLFEETFSLAVSEAWAHGRPVIASDSGALAERVEHDVNGWLFDVGDAGALARRLEWLDTPDGRDALVRMSRRLIETSASPQRSAASQYRHMYRELLDEPQTLAALEPHASADISPARMRGLLEQPLHRLESMLEACWRVSGSHQTELPRLIACIVHRGEPSSQAVRRTRVALDACEGISQVITIGHDQAPASRLPESGAQWVWLLRAGETPLPAAVPALRRHLADARSDQRLFIFDHLHATSGGQLHGMVCKPPWDRWLAATSTDFDCGWVIRAEVLRERKTGAELDQWLLTVLGSTFNSDAVVQVPLPVVARPDDELARAAAAVIDRRSQVGLGAVVDHDMLPPVIVIDSGNRSDLKATLENLLSLASRIPWLEVVGQGDMPSGDWPDNWRQCREASWRDDEKVMLIVRAGVLLADPESIMLYLPCLHDGEVGAIGLATQTPGGRRLGAARVIGHDLERIAPGPAWPGGPEDDWPALRKVASLNMDLTLARTDRIATVSAPLEPDEKLPVLLASDRVSGHWFNRPTSLSPIAEPLTDPLFSPRLGLSSPQWQLDPVAMQASVVSLRERQVLAVTPDDWASSQYRILQPLHALAERGDLSPPIVVKGDRHALPGEAQLARLDPELVLVHNCLDMDFLGRLHERRLILVIDDLLTALPDYNPFRARQAPDIEQRLAAYVTAAERIIVSTPELAHALSLDPIKTCIIENALPESPWLNLPARRRRTENHIRMRVGWAGAQQHEGDLRLLKPVVRATAGEVDWVLFGMCPDYLKPWVAETLAPVTFGNYPKTLARMDIDIAVAPLVDNAFNRCKSAIKLLEFGIQGIPVLASKLPPYDNSPARLLGPDPEQWIEAIVNYSRNREQLVQDGDRLRHWVTTHHLLASRLEDWHDALFARCPSAQ